MKDAIPEGLDLIGLKDVCTRKTFKSIPPKQIQLLHKALVKAKAQLGVATSGQKEKQKAHKDQKNRMQIGSSKNQSSRYCAGRLRPICTVNRILH